MINTTNTINLMVLQEVLYLSIIGTHERLKFTVFSIFYG